MKNSQRQSNLLIILLAALAASVLVACSGAVQIESGGGIVGTGKARITGNVIQSWQGDSVGGIQVTVDQQKSVTDARGYFNLAGVAAGNKKITFNRQGRSASLQVGVSNNAQVTLKNIRLANTTAKAQAVEKHVDDDDDDDDNDDDDSDDRDDDSNDRDDDSDDSDDRDDRDDDDDSSSGASDSDDDDKDDDDECRRASSDCDDD